MVAVEAAMPSRTRRYEYAAIYAHPMSLHFIVNASGKLLNIKAPQHLIAISYGRAALPSITPATLTVR
jgi:hypothetical protein